MKKITALLLALLMVSAMLAGCNSKKDSYTNPYSSISLEDLSAALSNADSYKTITVKQSEIDKQLDSAKKSLLSSNREDLKEGTVIKEGDVLKIDYSGILEGETEPFEGGSAKNQELEIGSDKFIEGFEDGLIGKKIGDKDIKLDLTFPKDYKSEKTDPEGAKKFNGKKVTFTVTVNSGKGSTYDDALIKKAFKDNKDSYHKYETVKEYEEETIKNIKSSLGFAEYKKLVKMVKFPTDLIEKEYNKEMDQWKSAAKTYGMTLEEFASGSNFYSYYIMGTAYSSLSKLADGVKKNATATVKDNYLVYYIYNANKSAIDKLYDEKHEDIIAELKFDFEQYAESNKITTKFEDAYEEEQLKDYAIQQVIYEFIADYVTAEVDAKETATPTPTATATATAAPTAEKTAE